VEFEMKTKLLGGVLLACCAMPLCAFGQQAGSAASVNQSRRTLPMALPSKSILPTLPGLPKNTGLEKIGTGARGLLVEAIDFVLPWDTRPGLQQPTLQTGVRRTYRGGTGGLIDSDRPVSQRTGDGESVLSIFNREADRTRPNDGASHFLNQPRVRQ